MDIYEELGVKKIINCAGTYTVVGGSRMSEASMAAMNEAARSHVVIEELQKAVYTRVAQLTRNEAACITSGAMAGIYLTIASCISMRYKKLFKYIAKERAQESEVIMFRAHRNPYDRGLEILGVKVVELGYPNNISVVTSEEFENAITEKTVAVLYLPSCKGGWVPPGALDFKSTLHIAQKYNVPVIVDAAAQLPPKSNLWMFTEAGASAVIFSGGKDLKGPQTTGLVLGKRELLQWVEANNFPKYGIGRMHKVGREELSGIYMAVKQYVENDEMARREECEKIVAQYVKAFAEDDCFHFERSWPNEAGQPIPRAKMVITAANLVPKQLEAMLAQNERSIFVISENGSIYINPMTIDYQEALYVLFVLKRLNEGMKNYEINNNAK